MAFGEGSSATAWFGTGNRAVARDGGIVIIVNADNNVGQADGPGSIVTIASGGQDNQITAINGGVAQYFGCTNLLLVADAGTNDFVFC